MAESKSHLKFMAGSDDNQNAFHPAAPTEVPSDRRRESGAMNKPTCKICKRNITRRVNRQGFLQRVVLYKLGFAPWECVFCRKPFLYPAK
jgi:hypothetical protein